MEFGKFPPRRAEKTAQAIPVASLRFEVALADDFEGNALAWRFLQDNETELRGSLESLVREAGFEPLLVRFSRGSIEVLIVLGFLGVLYHNVAEYQDFIQSLELLKNQTRESLRMFFGRSQNRPVSVSGAWYFHAAPPRATSQLGRLDWQAALAAYVLIGQVGLIGTLIWMIAKGLPQNLVEQLLRYELVTNSAALGALLSFVVLSLVRPILRRGR